MGSRKQAGLPDGALDRMLGGSQTAPQPTPEETDSKGAAEKTSGSGSPKASPAEKQTAPKPTRAKKTGTNKAPAGVEWNRDGGRKNSTYYLTEQLIDELETVWLRMRVEKSVRRSKSEIVEAALRIAIEDAAKDLEKSALYKRLTDEER